MTYVRLTHIQLYYLDLGFPIYNQFYCSSFRPHIILQYDVSQHTVISGGMSRQESMHDIAKKIHLRVHHNYVSNCTHQSVTCSFRVKWFSTDKLSHSPIYPLQERLIPPLEDCNLIHAFESLPLYYLRLLLARTLTFIDLEEFVLVTLQEHNEHSRLMGFTIP